MQVCFGNFNGFLFYQDNLELDKVQLITGQSLMLFYLLTTAPNVFQDEGKTGIHNCNKKMVGYKD